MTSHQHCPGPAPRRVLLAIALTLGGGAAASAAPLIDPALDFIPTYAGPQAGDLDVLSVSANFDGSSYRFSSKLNGPVTTTPGSLYVWGVDRGQGTARFGALASGVLFDFVVVVDPDGSSSVRDLIANKTTPLSSGAVTVSGDLLIVDVKASLVPSTGFAVDAYTANLWPRLGSGNNNQISDFAPDNANIAITAVPEPASALLLGGGLAAVLAWRRHPRPAAAN